MQKHPGTPVSACSRGPRDQRLTPGSSCLSIPTLTPDPRPGLPPPGQCWLRAWAEVFEPPVLHLLVTLGSRLPHLKRAQGCQPGLMWDFPGQCWCALGDAGLWFSPLSWCSVHGSRQAPLALGSHRSLTELALQGGALPCVGQVSCQARFPGHRAD